jgi:hypothetical protein
MTPNRQSPAYALFTPRSIVPQPPDVLAVDPPASQEPPRRPSARFPRRPPRRSLSLSGLARKPQKPIADPFPSPADQNQEAI